MDKDWQGKIFGRLTVLNKDGNIINVRCQCGVEKEVSAKNINITKSCGCLSREVVIKRNTKHGLVKNHKKAFNAWNALVQRCHNPDNPRFKDYGGRGIKVCKKWRKKIDGINPFEQFLKDMGDPEPGMEIDRKNNDKGYTKSNCRWITKRENMNNRRCTPMMTFKNETKPLSYWAESYGIPCNTLLERIKLGWTIKAALMRPIHRN
jgi:hypothetical protein